MPSQLKRASLARLLASLRSSRAGAQPSSFPVRTGFPTSLADIVVRNHGRLRKPRKPRRPAAPVAPPPSPCPVVAVEELSLTTPPPPPTQPLSPVAVDAPQVFRLRPELLAAGGAVALALLAVWGEGTVAAFTVAALSLLWIESASRRPRPSDTTALFDSCGRGPSSPIREAGEAPRSSFSDSDMESEASTPRTAELAAGGDGPATPKRKGKRSLRKLISRKLQRKPKSSDSSPSPDGDAGHPEAAGGDADPVPVLKTQSSVSASESSIEWSSSSSSSEAAAAAVDRRGPGAKFPLSAFVPVILTGLAAGKLPATALAVLCVAFSGAVRRLS